jgi:5-methylcytosine-specific restriction endonuclease McrA
VCAEPGCGAAARYRGRCSVHRLRPETWFTRWLRTAVLLRADGRCERCHAKAAVLRVDYWVPLVLGGADAVVNCWALCPECDRVKTRADQAAIARAKGWHRTPSADRLQVDRVEIAATLLEDPARRRRGRPSRRPPGR